MPLRRLVGLSAAVSGRLRRGLSTVASRPQWAIVQGSRPRLVNSTSHRATLQLAKPPCFSELLVPGHHINPLPRIDSEPESVGILHGAVCATSGDGLLVLEFFDGPAKPAFVAKVRAARESASGGTFIVRGNRDDIDPDITRLVCNPLSGVVFRLPDIDARRSLRLVGLSAAVSGRLVGLSAAVSGRLRRSLSTVASRPPWAMIHPAPKLIRSAAQRASFRLAEPPGVSRLFVPVHLVDHQPFPDATSDIVPMLLGASSSTSGDGLLLVCFIDLRITAPIVGADGDRDLLGFDMDPDTMRFVCNPLSGQLLRLPDIDGTKKTSDCESLGLLTRSAHGHGPPDRYAVAALCEDRRGVEKRSFVMRRFLSQTGEWEKLVDLPSQEGLLPLARPLLIHFHVPAFAGRLWWVDLSWGVVSADPFSDRPELRFVELPLGSVLPASRTRAESYEERTRNVYLHMGVSEHRRMGVSEGRLHYVELSRKNPFLVSSFVLDDDSSCWRLEHQVALGRLWAHGGQPSEDEIPRIGAIDPLNASIMHITIGTQVLAIDMNRGEVLGCLLLDEDELTQLNRDLGFTPFVLPPWLGSSSIPRGALNFKSKTLSDILVRAGNDKKK